MDNPLVEDITAKGDIGIRGLIIFNRISHCQVNPNDANQSINFKNYLNLPLMEN